MTEQGAYQTSGGRVTVRKLAVLMQSRRAALKRKKLRDWNPIDKMRSAFAHRLAGINVESPKKWELGRNRIITVLLASAAFLGTILLSSLIFHTSLTSQVGSFLLSLDFDDERVLLINQLMVTLLGTAISGAIFRKRIATILGGITYFLVFYLKQFVEQVQHPGVGPGGIKLELNPGALTSVTISLVALGLTSAALGTFIG